MLDVEKVLECKQLYGSGESIRSIAERVGVSRNTVRRYVRGERLPGEYRMKSDRRQPVRDEIAGRVRALLEEERAKETPRKQRLTAARIGRLLRAGGLKASDRTIRSAVKEARMALRDVLAVSYLPLRYRAGEDAQVDFFEAEYDDEEHGRTKVFVLLVRACYSGRTFVYVAPNQTRESLLEGLMLAFEFFGGVFLNLWFDNLTPAVRKVLRGRQREEQRGFECFRAHYGFAAQYCAPGRGNEKGGVEGEVRFARHEIFSPIPHANGRTGLQQLCREFMERDLQRVIRTHARSIGEEWRDEVPHLLPLPQARFDGSMPRLAKVSSRSWVSVGTSMYSVPVAWVGQVVTLKLYAETVRILGPQGERVEHPRSYTRFAVVLNVEHYLPLLRRKSRGIDRAWPLQQFLDSTPGEWRGLLLQLRRHRGEVLGSQEFVDVLGLIATYGMEHVRDAVARALRHPVVSLGTVRFFLWAQREAEAPKVDRIDYGGPIVEQGSPRDYAVLQIQESEEVAHG
jgi:transposase